MAVKPTLIRRIVYPRSSWVFSFMLTCDNQLAIQFWRRLRDIRLPGHKKGASPGRVPGVCCLYPATTQAWFNLMLVWGSKGKFVHQFLYKKMGYRIIAAPRAPFGCKETLIVMSSVNPSMVGQAVTFTAVYTNTSGTATPEGTINWSFDGIGEGTGSASTSGNTMTSVITTGSLTAGSHSIMATFADLTTGNEGFDPGTGSLIQVVGGVMVPCCGVPVANTLILSLGGVTHFAPSYTLNWIGGDTWTSGTFSVGGGTQEFILTCAGIATPSGWNLTEICNGSAVVTTPGTSGACSPFFLGFSVVTLKYGAFCVSPETPSSITVTP